MGTDALDALELPQVHAAFRREGTRGTPSRRTLVLGGRSPKPEWLSSVARGLEVWAVDSGLDACRNADVVPSRIIGDLDSVSEAGQVWAAGKAIPVDRYPTEKDDTDFQLALALSGGKGILVTGCWGGRFDHAFSNIFSAVGVLERGTHILCFADERETLFPLMGSAELQLAFPRPPLALSLLSLTERCRGVTAKNVKWPLSGATLLQSRPREVSNVLLEREATLSVEEGILGVYAAFA